MNRLKYTIVISIVFVLSGCVSPSYNYIAKSIDVSEPPINQVVTAYVGDNLIRQGHYAEHDAIYVPNDTEAKTMVGYIIKKGYYYKKGDDEYSEYYLPEGIAESGSIEKCGICDPWKILQAYKDEPKLCIITVFNLAVCNSESFFERRKVPLLSANSFQQTLIYSGKLGNKINIGYREFSNSLARPAFNNNVEYDLSESKVIGYKGAKLEIIEATNELIKYKVINNFNKSNM